MIMTSFTDGFPSISDVAEPVFIAKASVKTLNKSVMCRFAGLDKPQFHGMLISPLVNCSSGKFWPLVSSYRSRIAAKQGNTV